jgi:hypothetical protein
MSRLLPALLFCLLRAPAPARAAATPRGAPLEFEVKAAFLLNFTRFIDWPPAESPSSSPFTLCILGDDPFGPTLDQTVQGEKVGVRPLAVHRLGHESPAPGACQVLYVSRSESEVKTLLSGLGPGVLTVGEGETFTQSGGMIAFVLDNRRIRFVVNLAAARPALLTLSSRLLAVAKAVEK